METHRQNDTIARIRFLIEKMHMSQAAFAKRLGIDPANMSKHLNGKLPITPGLINRIAADMAVSKQWLATGSGIPFPKESTALQVTDCLSPESGTQCMSGAIPVYDIDVTAGCLGLDRELTDDRIIGSIDIPSLRRDCIIVRVNGDSMTPTISDGAFVAIRSVTDLSCIFWGQIYVIVMDDFRMVKHLRRHPDPSMVILRSDNPAYDDMEVPLDKIRRLYIVETILNLKIQC